MAHIRFKIGECICPDCIGSGKKQELFINSIDINMKEGDKVEIVGNIPFQLKDKPRPLLGTITNIDGHYILVRPKYQRYECEFYICELKPKK